MIAAHEQMKEAQVEMNVEMKAGREEMKAAHFSIRIFFSDFKLL